MLSGAGKTLAENLAALPGLKEGQQVIQPLEKPIKSSGHLQILYGNLAPEGCVGKITGKEGLRFEGPARVFDSEEDMLAALDRDPQSLKVCIFITIGDAHIPQRQKRHQIPNVEFDFVRNTHDDVRTTRELLLAS